MKSLEDIRADNAAAASRAAKKKQEPLVLEAEDIEDWRFVFPDMGDYTPPGWHLTKSTLLCDVSGFGTQAEPALTVKELHARLRELQKQHPEYGYGIISAGQFQCLLGIFVRTPQQESA
jgi:hypothetical protein